MKIVHYDESKNFSLKKAKIILKCDLDERFYLERAGKNDCRRINMMAITDHLVDVDFYHSSVSEYYLTTIMEANPFFTTDMVREYLVIEAEWLIRNNRYDYKAWKRELILFALAAVGELCMQSGQILEQGFTGDIVIDLKDERVKIWYDEGTDGGLEDEPCLCETSTPIV